MRLSFIDSGFISSPLSEDGVMPIGQGKLNSLFKLRLLGRKVKIGNDK